VRKTGVCLPRMPHCVGGIQCTKCSLVCVCVVQHDRLRLNPSSLRVPQHLTELRDDDKILHKDAEVSSVTVTTIMAAY